MKRIFSILLPIILVLTLPSCTQGDGSSQWEFNYTLEKVSFLQGETIKVTVEVTNVGKDYDYVGSPHDLFGPATLYLNSDEEQTLSTLPFVSTDDATKRVFKKGEKASRSYEFSTDESSPEGIYSLKVPFGGEVAVFDSVLLVDAPPTEEELEMIALADAFMATEYPALSLEDCRVETRQNTKGEYTVEYTLTIGSYRTWESYTVRFDADKKVENSYSSHEGVYSVYLHYATEEKIREAEDKLTQQLEKYDTHSGFYLQIDDDGYLCLVAEVIVEPAFGDHKHKFFNERICGESDNPPSAE